ncbi:DegT/DnrJ/EryC1/StrS family aminotransferase [Vallitalea pronyensis]|uniref:DegT/DnrJ/EryC1/StrS family aminotransferase n=1 Tax=Vallitalea pronyensis TaxID=1348613 RepID=A0A8J8MLR2_9FIRM|nr:DegT/DnrJ/EryC1/StrS family aminotransferase [Vallitalea pronyensis]QUI23851.1 DegT/DnrJ/EryC1/StrS family aminotransferase [Vallitalea pronyensis]
MKNELAIYGGKPSVSYTSPHFRWPELCKEGIEAVYQYLMEGKPISIADGTGIIEELEDLIREYLNVKYVLTTNSGTNALHSAYIALDLPLGSEIICQNVTFHASITPAIHCGLSPVLVDVQPDTGNVDPKSLREAITKKTKAIVINHTWGHPAEMDEILQICIEKDIRLIEDCSHAFGSTYRGEKVGTFGDIAIISMQASKAISAGEGGILVTNNQLYYERACLTGHYRGRSEKEVTDPYLKNFTHTGFGLKYRLHPIAAVIAKHELLRIDEIIEKRNHLLGILSEGLRRAKGIRPPAIRSYVTMGSFYGYKPEFVPNELFIDNRLMNCDEYIKILSAEGLEIHRPSVRPLSEFPIFQDKKAPLQFAKDTWKPRIHKPLEGSKEYFENRLSLPTFTNMNSLPLVKEYIKAFNKVSDYFMRNKT